MHCQFITSGLDTEGLRAKLNARPELFDGVNYRKEPRYGEKSPHREVSDIHIRYNSLENEKNDDFHTAPHIPKWYPVTKEIPEAAMLATDVCGIVGSEMLGSVFILKLKPGGRIYPHIDKSWNSTYFDKYLVGIQGGEGGIFRFQDKTCFEAQNGEVYRFENNIIHSITNFSDQDWIALIVNCRPVLRGFSEDLCPKTPAEVPNFKLKESYKSDGVVANKMTIPKGCSVGKHVHPYSHLSMLASGRVQVSIAGREPVELKGGDFVEIKEHESHVITALEDSVWVCIHSKEEMDDADQLTLIGG